MNHVVNLGNTIEVEVTTQTRGITQVDSCVFVSPSGETKLERVSFTDVGSRMACRLSIGPVTEKMTGEWQIIGKFSNQQIFEEMQHTFYIIKEDPANPIQDDTRSIENLDIQFVKTEMGASHTISITSFNTWDGVESCHIRTPEGLQYILMEGFNVTGVEVIETVTACRVSINLLSEDVIGEWMLILRETTFSGPLERRLPFIIYVEEYVNASPKVVNITEGSDMYVRLETPTPLHDTCRLLESSGNESTSQEPDKRFIDSCGFIVRSVDVSSNGTWEIRYGKKIIYRAPIMVIINEKWVGEDITFVWTQNKQVNELIGPEDAVYCRVEDPTGFVILDGFSRCKIVLEKATMEHIGTWKMTVGLPGRVLTDEYQISVDVIEKDQTVVNTHVEKDSLSMTLSCSVPSLYEVRACKFREPSGRVLLSSYGIGEDRYTYHGTQVSLESSVHSHSCGIRIVNPVVSDLGLWRCAVDTDGGTYYGFLSVLCHSAVSDPKIAASIVSEPTLTAHVSSITEVEGKSVTMTCSIQSAIRYCYFRYQNGTVFSVGPDTSTESIEYIGAGFEAGECGIRFRRLHTSDTGHWSCHVGFHNVTEPEQLAPINVTIQDAIVVDKYKEEARLVVSVVVRENTELEYCRFVRIDGLGFTKDNLPDGYYSTLTNRRCTLKIANPTMLDQHPWTAVAKIKGQVAEISKVTTHFLEAPEIGESLRLTWIIFSVLLMLSLLTIAMLGVPKKNRTWITARASVIRMSFRKTPLILLPEENVKNSKTSEAA